MNVVTALEKEIEKNLIEDSELTELDLAIIKHVEPRNDRILTRPILAPQKTAGGVYLPESKRERDSLRAVVLAVGPGRLTDKGERVKIDLNPGDVVSYPIMAGSPVLFEGKEYLMLIDSQIGIRIKQGGV